MQKNVQATWFFRRTLDAGLLRSSLDALIAHHPVLGGRVERERRGRWSHLSPLHGWQLRGADEVDLRVFTERSRQASYSSAAAASVSADASSRYLVGVPSAPSIMRGSAPILSARLTTFESRDSGSDQDEEEDAGCALALSISHSLVDAHGFYRVAAEWSRLCAQHWEGIDEKIMEAEAEPIALDFGREKLERILTGGEGTKTHRPLTQQRNLSNRSFYFCRYLAAATSPRLA